VNDRRLLLVLGGVFATLAVLLLFLGVTVTPVALGVAVPFAGVAYLLWYHATGRLEERAYERARAANAGSREPGERSRRAKGARESRADATDGAGGSQRARESRRRPPAGMSEARAREVLGVESDASEADVQRAYRERVKDVHPDRGGDPDAFRRVQRAYERLRE